jgi:hypothetical protein
MQIVINNPFRVIGLLANCTEREIQKQKALIKRFLSIGKEIAFDTDLQLPHKCDRTEEGITSALAKLEQVKSKVTNGLFWFVNNNHLDDTAITYLRDGDTEKAVEIWEKLIPTTDIEITARNITAANNLSTLKLSLAFEKNAINRTLLSEGIILKSKVVDSDFIIELINQISDETYKLNKDELIQVLANELLSNISNFLDKPDGITSAYFISIFNNTSPSLKNQISKRFVEKPLHSTQSKIEETISKRKDDKTKGYELGNDLFIQTNNNLNLLKNILGANDLQYSMLADNVAEELLRCGTDYFNSYKDSNEDPGINALKLSNFGIEIACGFKIKDKLKEDIKFLHEWNAGRIEREKRRKINTEYNAKPATIDNAKIILNHCKPKLYNAKIALGVTDELYLGLSSRVGSDAHSILVNEVNKAMDDRNKYVEYQNYLINPMRSINRGVTYDSNGLPQFLSTPQYVPEYSILQLKSVLKNAWDTSLIIGSLDMNTVFRNKYNDNKATLLGLCNQLGVTTSIYNSIQNATSKTVSNKTASNQTGSGIPAWIYWVGGIILLIILSKTCNS